MTTDEWVPMNEFNSSSVLLAWKARHWSRKMTDSLCLNTLTRRQVMFPVQTWNVSRLLFFTFTLHTKVVSLYRYLGSIATATYRKAIVLLTCPPFSDNFMLPTRYSDIFLASHISPAKKFATPSIRSRPTASNQFSHATTAKHPIPLTPTTHHQTFDRQNHQPSKPNHAARPLHPGGPPRRARQHRPQRRPTHRPHRRRRRAGRADARKPPARHQGAVGRRARRKGPDHGDGRGEDVVHSH